MVEGLAPDAADNPFTVGVHPRRSWRALDHVYAVGLEDGVEGLAVLAIAVTEQEPQGFHTCVQVGGYVPGLLHGPVPGGMCREA
ncbi:hypothetical protein SSPO_078600 [Streptomyces antimycoticus]|uniref:Uncharacterized protein n=1 Tax=Streptomyces antimycoticus TaxID=68175 RepID=A0A499UVF2_9ACTN|nr:hypothetical protein SSPO_078600 [Streptomyces antimycoticus]